LGVERLFTRVSACQARFNQTPELHNLTAAAGDLQVSSAGTFIESSAVMMLLSVQM
jgi:hypothetical protein